MSRRVKLTTEWVEWREQDEYGELCYRLCGARDYVAEVMGTENDWTCDLFPDPQYTDDWHYYDNSNQFDESLFTSAAAAMNACERRLLAHGLIDPLWWVTQ